MTAEVGGGLFRLQPPSFDGLPQEIVHATGFAGPSRIFPGSAHRRSVFEPRRFRSAALELLSITEFERAAGSLKAEEFVFVRQGSGTVFPITIDRAHVANEGSDTGHGANQQMIFAAAAQVDQETALRNFAAEERVTGLQLEKTWSQAAAGNQLDKKFERVLVRRRDHGVRTLGSNAVAFDAERGVLSSTVCKGAAGIHMQDAQILGDVAAIEDSRLVIFVRRNGHLPCFPAMLGFPRFRHVNAIRRPGRRPDRRWRHGTRDKAHQRWLRPKREPSQKESRPW